MAQFTFNFGGQKETKKENTKENKGTTTKTKFSQATTYKYDFESCENESELKKEYLKACKVLHPDHGGDTELFQKMQADYEKARKEILYKNHFESESLKRTENYKPSEIMKATINKVVGFSELDIALVGSWLWVSGETLPYREQLKNLGFRWSRTKKMWYFAEDLGTKKRYKQDDFETIKNRFGFAKVKTREQIA